MIKTLNTGLIIVLIAVMTFLCVGCDPKEVQNQNTEEINTIGNGYDAPDMDTIHIDIAN
jgi:hypothetical protein